MNSLKATGEVPLAGYSDRLSARPGDTVRFCLSANPAALASKNSSYSDSTSASFAGAEAAVAPPTPAPPVVLRARLSRSICADPNPKGPGIVEEDASQWFPDRTLSARHQPIPRGSYASTAASISLGGQEDVDSVEAVTVDVWFYPTLISPSPATSPPHVDGEGGASRPASVVWSWGDSLALYLMADGCLRFLAQGKSGTQHTSNDVTTATPCKPRRWYHVICTLKSDGSRSVTVKNNDATGSVHASATGGPPPLDGGAVHVLRDVDGPFSLATGGRLNGRIEDPSIRYVKARPTRIDEDAVPTSPSVAEKIVLATWDTSCFPSSEHNENDGADLWTIPCAGRSLPSGDPLYSLRLYHHPTRAVRGHLWDGTEFCWAKCPRQYGAVHFHDDDVYDFEWTPDMEWKVPLDVPSGIYVMRFSLQRDEGDSSHEGIEEALPIFICAPRLEASPTPTSTPPLKKPKTKKKLAVLIPTFTYVMYGNHARPDFEPDLWMARTKASPGAYPYNPCQYPKYGWSTYNFHSDSSGIHFASHLRPLFNLRPGYITFSRDGGYNDDGKPDGRPPASSDESFCSGLRHFPADSHLIAWLHHHHVEYEIVTDHELHREGVAALDRYSTLLTSSHPEYHTRQTLDALQAFRDEKGGNLVYLGGNGFYWKVAASQGPPSAPGDGASTPPPPPSCSLLEVRRCETGVRTWAAQAGEYYHLLDGGGYGGLWRNSGRPPSQLVGIGFAAQGGFVGRPYLRTCWDRPDVTDWVFRGLPPKQTRVLGNFGFSGNGAAGYELDRTDPADADSARDREIVILAQARTGSDGRFVLVPEEVLTPWTNQAGTSNDEAKRADMVYFRDPRSGAQVFAVGSITFCGSLPYNRFDNVISTVLKNVVDRFLEGGE